MPQNRSGMRHYDGLPDPLDTLAGAAKEAKVVNLTPRASVEKPVP